MQPLESLSIGLSQFPGLGVDPLSNQRFQRCALRSNCATCKLSCGVSKSLNRFGIIYVTESRYGFTRRPPFFVAKGHLEFNLLCNLSSSRRHSWTIRSRCRESESRTLLLLHCSARFISPEHLISDHRVAGSSPAGCMPQLERLMSEVKETTCLDTVHNGFLPY
jgi:hypothetical protein